MAWRLRHTVATGVRWPNPHDCLPTPSYQVVVIYTIPMIKTFWLEVQRYEKNGRPEVVVGFSYWE